MMKKNIYELQYLITIIQTWSIEKIFNKLLKRG